MSRIGSFSVILFMAALASLVCDLPRAEALICPGDGGNPQSAYDYFNAVGEVLVQVRFGRDELQAIAKQRNDPDFGTEFLKVLKVSQLYYQCAVSIAKVYELSTNSIISAGSKRMRTDIEALSGANIYRIEQIKRLLSGTDEKDAGKKADAESEVQVETESAWSDLGLSTVTATYALLGYTSLDGPARNDKTLVITSSQKRTLVEKFEHDFGKKMNPKENRVVEVSAHQLLKFLKEKWKLANTSK